MTVTPSTTATSKYSSIQKPQYIHEDNTFIVSSKVPRKSTHSWPVIYKGDCPGENHTFIKSPQYEFDAAMFLSQNPTDILNHCLENQLFDRHSQATLKSTNQNFSLGPERINFYHDTSNAIDDNHNTISNDRSMNDSSSIHASQHIQTQLPQNGCTSSPNPLAILFLTLLMTSGASALLCAGIMTSQWEFVRWDMKILKKLANESTHTKDIEWLLNGKVARIPIRGEIELFLN